MSRIFSDFTAMIGRTPMVELARLAAAEGVNAHLLAKLERANPAGSAKDRVALSMIRTAEAEGKLAPGGTIIEPTSGNTGVGLAACAAVLGYRCILVMPDSMSRERISLMRAYGAEVELTPGALGMRGSIERAEQLHRQTPGSIIAGQFSNPANPQAHFDGTGPEIFSDCDGQLDAFVATVGTGGTLSGTGRYLRQRLPALHIAAAEPAASPLLSGGQAGTHAIQGIGANFIPETLDRSVYDEVITVSDEAAMDMMRRLPREEGLLCGISSGAAVCAALTLAKRERMQGKTIVVLLPDTGERYLSLWD